MVEVAFLVFGVALFVGSGFFITREDDGYFIVGLGLLASGVVVVGSAVAESSPLLLIIAGPIMLYVFVGLLVEGHEVEKRRIRREG